MLASIHIPYTHVGEVILLFNSEHCKIFFLGLNKDNSPELNVGRINERLNYAVWLENLGGSSGVHRNFVRGGGVSTNSVEYRGQGERGSGGGSPLVRGSGGSCNLVQEISFHILKFS